MKKVSIFNTAAVANSGAMEQRPLKNGETEVPQVGEMPKKSIKG
jgi:hypothetical protein